MEVWAGSEAEPTSASFSYTLVLISVAVAWTSSVVAAPEAVAKTTRVRAVARVAGLQEVERAAAASSA